MVKDAQRAVVLLSGGMDSCVCAALAARDHETAAVHVSYGQRTEERERRSFESICDRLGIHERLAVHARASERRIVGRGNRVLHPLEERCLGAHTRDLPPAIPEPERNSALIVQQQRVTGLTFG